jgi:hypothetical protein
VLLPPFLEDWSPEEPRPGHIGIGDGARGIGRPYHPRSVYATAWQEDASRG